MKITIITPLILLFALSVHPVFSGVLFDHFSHNSDGGFEKGTIAGSGIMEKMPVLKAAYDNSLMTTGCAGSETCFDVASVITPVTDGNASCVQSCNDMNVSEAGDCDAGGASVWFKVQTDASASVLIYSIEGPFSPIVTAYRGSSCSAMEIVPNFEQCKNANLGEMAVNVNETIWLRVEAKDGENLGTFDLCVHTLFNAFDCYDATLLSVTRPQHPNADPNGPYKPGENVSMCFQVDFYNNGAVPPGGNNCQWIQGIIPNLSDGWDIEESNLNIQGPGSNWFWLDEGQVDYNFNSSIYSIATVDGRKTMVYGGANAGLTAGTTLPGAWWVVSNGSNGCANDGDPDNMWGMPASCNGIQSLTFCIELKVKDAGELFDCEFQNLNLTLVVTADGETGCWANNACGQSIPFVFNAGIDCSVDSILVEIPDATVCKGTCITVSPSVSGGAGSNYTFLWDDGMNAPSRTVCPEVTTTYTVIVTDDQGNTGSATVTVTITVIPNPKGVIFPKVYSFCYNGSDDPLPSMVAYVDQSSSNYIYNWLPTPGIAGGPTTLLFNNDAFNLDEATSDTLNYPKSICVQVIDANGCVSVLCSDIHYQGMCTDTCFVIVTDSVTTTITDTLYTFINDTIYTQISDTSYIAVEDTLIINVLLSFNNEPATAFDIRCYPNPAGALLYIDIGEAEPLKDIQAVLTNEAGVTIFSQTIADKITTWKVSDKPKGLYFISFYDGLGKLLNTKKVVIR